jgi:iron complex outermembrane receptor protein
MGLNYIFNQANSIYAYVGIANREPNRSVFRDADPEQEVKPELLTDYELGYKYKSKLLSLEANLFYMDYKDQLVLTGKINNVGAPIMTNVPDSYRTGIEFMGGVKFLKIVNWYLNATYSLNKIKNFTEYVDNWNYWDDPESEPYQYEKELGTTDISYSPDFTLSSELNVEPFSNFNIAWVSNYVSRQYIDNTSNIDRSIDPYLINNLRFVYSIKTSFIKQIDLLLTLNNILNAKYETNAWVYRYVYEGEEGVLNGYFPQAEFNFMAGINLKF